MPRYYVSTKYSRRKLYPEYKAYVATLPCIVCGRWPVEVAHVGDRGFGQKCDDRETLPICTLHHREGKEAAHVLGKRFYEHHGLDRDELIRQTQADYERSRGKPVAIESQAIPESFYFG